MFPRKYIPAHCLSEIMPISLLSTMRGTVGERLAGSSERHTAQLFRTTASHGVFVQERAQQGRKGEEDAVICDTAGPEESL